MGCPQLIDCADCFDDIAEEEQRKNTQSIKENDYDPCGKDKPNAQHNHDGL